MSARLLEGRKRPKKQRAGMAAIRWIYTFTFPGLGFIVTFVADNFMNLGIARVPVALVIGAFAYSLKRYWSPDSKW